MSTSEILIDGFTKRYGVHVLVSFEMHESMVAAIRREKQIKEWRQAGTSNSSKV